MTRDELKVLLETQTDSEFIDQRILSSRPWLFATDETYRAWQGSVADSITIGRDCVRIVGSAATGFSLSPLKPGRPFRKVASGALKQSDVDIALIDPALFVKVWNDILLYDRRRALGGTDESRDKIRMDIYWGFVSQYNVPRNTDVARRLLVAASVASRSAPVRGHPVSYRLYRRLEDLHGYHVASLRALRSELSTS